MTTLLRIDTSPRTEGSHSRNLADFIESKWKEKHPEGRIIYRDLNKTEIPHIHNDTILGFYTPEDQMTLALKESTSLSDELIRELKESDEILIASPLYNLSVPSNLKAWIDQVTRVKHTIAANQDGSYTGLLKGRTAYLALVKGARYEGTPMQALDFQTPYLKAILNFMGIEVADIFSLEGTSDTKALSINLPAVQNQITRTFNH